MTGVFVLVLALAAGAAWLADQPGTVTIQIGGWEIATSLLIGGLALIAFAGVVVLIWLTYHWIVDAPAALGAYVRARKRRRGMDALSRGLVAASAGDTAGAAREAASARQQLGDIPLTLLLRAQSAQLGGDEAAAELIFQSMLERPDTAALGLRGLFMAARKAGNAAGARALAERASAEAPQVAWAPAALFELQSAEGDWAGALHTLELRRRHKQVERPAANRLSAVLRTAQAQAAIESDPAGALDNALEAHRLVPELVPAAAIAARLLAEDGEAGRAARIIERTWRANPHPDLVMVYAHVRPGEAPRERLARVQSLAARTPDHVEGALAVARAALEARAFAEARSALEPHLDGAPSQRVCALMAEIEDGEHGDRGRVREWLARAVNAPRDPAWTADGFVSPHWLAVSPVTGRLDAFEWKVPVEGLLPDAASGALIAGARVLEIDAASEVAKSDSGTGESDGETGPAAGEGTVVESSAGASDGEQAKADEAEDAGGAFPPPPDDPGVAPDADDAAIDSGEPAPASNRIGAHQVP